MKEQGLENLSESLSEQPNILGKEEYYFNSAVSILLVKVDTGYHFLFQQRASEMKQSGEICFPGGKYEPEIDDNYRQTAIRETIEELGIKEEKVEIVGRLNTIVAPMGVTVDSFISVLNIDNLDELSVNENEVAKVFTIPVSYFEEHKPDNYKVRLEIQPSYTDEKEEKKVLFPAKKLGLPERYTKPWGGKKYDVYVYELDKKTIWGITAQLIREFVRKLNNS
ncbi:NUDIX domain-containing protein [Halanaerocella petrolearia]